MNKIFRVIWNHSTQTWQAVSELAKGQTKSESNTTAISAPSAFSAALFRLSLPATLLASISLLLSPFAYSATVIGTTTPTGNGNPETISFQAQKTHSSAQGAILIFDNGLRNTEATNRNPHQANYGTSSTANTALQSVNIGANVQLTGNGQSVAIGNDILLSGHGAVAIGGDDFVANRTELGPLLGITLADRMTASNDFTGGANDVWRSVKANGRGAVALGSQAQALGNLAVALGVTSTAKERASVAIGPFAESTAEGATALGPLARATGQHALSLGSNSLTQSNHSVAIGTNATVRADKIGGVAIGANSTDTGSSATLANTTQLVFDASPTTTRPTTTINNFAGTISGQGSFVSVGNSSAGSQRKIINLAAGDLSASSTEAVNGSQLFAVAKNFDDRLKAINEPSLLALNAANRLQNTSFAIKTQNGTATASEARAWKVDGTAQDITLKAGDYLSVSHANGVITHEVKTQGITTNANGVAALATNNAGLATAATVRDAVNNSGFKLSANNETGFELVKAGIAVKIKEGTNVNVTRSGSEITVNAWNTVVSQGDDITITRGATDNQANRVNDFKVALSATTKALISDTNVTAEAAKTTADSALQTIAVKAGGQAVKNLTKTANEIEFIGDGKNVTVSNDNSKVKVAFSDTPSLTSVTTTGAATVGGMLNANGGLTVAANKTVDFNNNRLSKVGDATQETDAVNLKQLKNNGFVVSDGNSETTLNNTNTAGGSNKVTIQGGKNTSVTLAEAEKTLTIDSWDTKVSAGNGLILESESTNNVEKTRSYTLGLNTASQNALNKANTALQTLTTTVGGTVAQTLNKNSTAINFTQGSNVKLTASNTGIDVALADNLTDVGNIALKQGSKITNLADGADDGDAANVKTVKDLIRDNAEWQIKNNNAAAQKVGGTNKTVNFTDGTQTTAVLTTENNEHVVKINVAEATLRGDVTTGNLESSDGLVKGSDLVTQLNNAVNTLNTKLNNAVSPTTLSVANGKVSDPAEGSKLVTAATVKEAINGVGFNVTANDETTGTLVKAGDTLTVKQGDNIEVTRKANSAEFTVKTKDNVSFATVTAKTSLTVGDTQNSAQLTNDSLTGLAERDVTAADYGTDKTRAATEQAVKSVETMAKAAKTEVVGVKQASVKAQAQTGANGQTIYEVSATKTTLAEAANGGVTVSGGTESDQGILAYEVGLNEASKASLASADSAVQTIAVKADGQAVKTLTKTANEIEFIGDSKNVTVSNDNNKVKVAFSDTPSFTSVTTTGEATVGGMLNANGGLTVAANKTVDFGNNTLTKVASGGTVETNAANIGDVKNAAKAAKTEVVGVKQASVKAQDQTGANGQTIYEVSATKTTLAEAANGGVTVSGGAESDQGILAYEVGLDATSKASLALADSAMQTLKTSANGSEAQTLNKTDGSINFTSGKDVVLGATANGISIKVANTSLAVADSGDNKGSVTAPTGDAEVAFVNAKDLASTLNSMGFNVFQNDTDKGQVNAGDSVKFSNGEGTIASVSTTGAVTTVKFDADTTAIQVDAATGEVTTIGDVDANKLATAKNVAEAIKQAGFKLKSSVNGGEGSAAEDLINAGESVEIVAGKNLKVAQTGGTVTLSTKDEVSFNTITVPTSATANPITISADGINAAGKSITGVGSNQNDDTAAANIRDVKELVARNAEWKIKNNAGTAEKVGGENNVVNFANGTQTTAVVSKVADGDKGYQVQFNVVEGEVEKTATGFNAKTAGVVNATNLANQLNAVKGDLESATFGFITDGANNNSITKAVNNQIGLKGANSNIVTAVSANGNDVTIGLNNTLTGLTSASFGATNPVVVSETGINLNNKVITNSGSGIVTQTEADDKNVATIGNVKELAEWTIQAGGQNAFKAGQSGQNAERTDTANKVKGAHTVNFVGTNGVNVLLQEQAGNAGYNVELSLSTLDAFPESREQLTPSEKSLLVTGKALEDGLKVLNDKGMSFAGDEANEKVARKLGETLSIQGAATGNQAEAKNISVKRVDDHTLGVSLNADLANLTSATFGKDSANGLKLTNNALAIADNALALTAKNLTFKDSVTISADEKAITGLAARNTETAGYGTGNNANRAATEGAVKGVNDRVTDLATNGIRVGATLGEDNSEAKNVVTQKLGGTLSIVEAEDFEVDGKTYEGANLKTKVTLDAQGNSKVEIGLNQDIKLDNLTLEDKDSTTKVDANGLSLTGKDGKDSTLVGKDGIGISGENGVTTVTDGGATFVNKDAANPSVTTIDGGKITATGKDGESVLSDSGLTVSGKDGQDAVSVKTDADGNGQIAVNGKDGVNGITLSAKDGVGTIGLNGKDGASSDIQVAKGTKGLDGTNGDTRLTYTNNGQTESVASLNDGLAFVGDDQAVVNRKLNQKLSVTGGETDTTKLSDNNIGVVKAASDDGLVVKLAKELTALTSANFVSGTNAANLNATSLNFTGNNGVVSGLEARNQRSAAYGKDTNANRAATEGAVLDVVTTGFKVDATVGDEATQSLSKTLNVVEAQGNGFEDNGKTFVGNNLKTKVTQTATGEAQIEIGLNKNIEVEKLDLKDDKGNTTTVTPTGVVSQNDDGRETVLNQDGVSVSGENGVSRVDDGKVTVSGDNGASGLNDKGLTVVGNDPSDKGSSNVGKDGLTVVGKDGKDAVSVKADADGNGQIVVNGKDGVNGLTISAKDGVGTIGLNGKDGASSDIQVAKGTKGLDGTNGDTRLTYTNNGQTESVASLNDGLAFVGDDQAVVNRKLNQKLSVTGGETDTTKLSDNNIGVVKAASDDGLVVKLAKELTALTSANFVSGTNAANLNATTLNFTGNNGVVSGLEARNQRSTAYGTGTNANRAATEGAVLDVVTTGFKVDATVGDEATQSLSKTLNVVEAQGNGFEDNGKTFVGNNLKTKVTQTAAGEAQIEIGLNKNIEVEKLDLKDDKGNTTTVTPTGVVSKNDDGRETVLNQDGVSVSGENGVSRVDDGKVTVSGDNGASGLNDKGLTVVGNDPADKGSSSVGKDGLTVVGKDGKGAVSVKADADGNGQIVVNGKDGVNGITLSAKDGVGTIGLNGKDGASSDIQVAKGTKGLDGTNGDTRLTYTNNGQIESVASLNDGLAFVGDDQAVVNRKLNQKLSVTGGQTEAAKLSDNNIGVVKAASDDGLVVKLAKELTALTSANFVSGTNAANLNATSLNFTGNNGVVSGLEARNQTSTAYGTGTNANRAATEGAVLDVVTTGFKVDATVGDEATQSLSKTLNVVEAQGNGFEDNGKTFVGNNLKTKVTQTATGEAQIEIGLNKNIEVSQLELKDDKGNTTTVTPTGVVSQNDDGRETVLNQDGVSVSGENGVSRVDDGKVTVSGDNGASGLNDKGLTVVGNDPADKGSSSVGKDGLTVIGKDGQDAVALKADENGSQLTLKGKDGENGITLTATDGADGKSALEFKDGKGVVDGLKGIVGTTPAGATDAITDITKVADAARTAYNNQAVSGKDLFNVIDNGLRVNANQGGLQTHKLGNEIAVIAAELNKDIQVGDKVFEGKNLQTRVSQDTAGKTTIEIGLNKNIEVEKLDLKDDKGNATSVTPTGVSTTNADGTKTDLTAEGIEVAGKDGKDSTVIGKDGIGIDGEQGSTTLTDGGATFVNKDATNPSVTTIDGGNLTTVGKDGKSGLNGEGLTVSGTGANGDKGESTVGKDGLTVIGKDGQDAVALKADENGSQLTLKGKDGENGITLTATDGADGKSALEFKDGKGVVDGLKGIVGTRPAGATDAITDITKVADAARTVYNNQAVSGKDLFNVIDNGLRVNANQGGLQTHKLGNEIAVIAAELNKDIQVGDKVFEGKNLQTRVSQDTAGKTTIEIGLNKNIEVEKLDLKDDKGNATSVTPTGVSTTNADGTKTDLTAEGIEVAGKDGKDSTVIGKDGIGIDGEQGSTTLTDGGATFVNKDATNPSVTTIDGGNLTTVGKDGKSGLNGEGLTVSGTGANGDKGESTVGKDGLTVSGKDGQDAVALKADENGSQLTLKGKDGENGITLTATDGADGKSALEFKDGKGVVDGLKGIVGTTPAGATDAITDITKVADAARTAYNNQAVSGKDLFNVIDNGLRVNANQGGLQTHKLGNEIAVIAAELNKDIQVGDKVFEGKNLQTRVSQDTAGKTTIEIGLNKNIEVEKLDLKDDKGNATSVTPTGVSTTNADGTKTDLTAEGIEVAGKDGKDSTVIGKDGIGIDGEQGSTTLTDGGATFVNKDATNPSVTTIDGGNLTTVGKDGKSGLNGEGLTVSGTGANGDKGESTVGKDGLTVIGKDGQDAVALKADENGSQLTLKGKDGENGITLTATDGADGKSALEFKDGKGVVDGLKGIVGTRPAGATDAITDITKVADAARTVYNNQAVSGKDLFNVIDNGLRVNANQGGLQTHKLGNEIAVIAAELNKDIQVGDKVFEGKNLQTRVSQDAAGKTTIEIGLNKNIEVEKLDLKDDKGNATSVTPTGVSTTNADGTKTDLTAEGIEVAGKDGKDSTVIGKDGIGIDGEQGSTTLTDGGATFVNKDATNPSVTTIDGGNLTTVGKDGKSGLNGEGLTVSGTGANGDKGESTVGKDGLTVSGKDGQDAVALKADENGSQLTLKGKDGENGITLTATDGADGKSALEFKDGKGVVDGLKGIVGTTPAGATDAITDITKVADAARTAYNNQAVSGKDLFNVIDNGLRVNANQGGLQTHKLGNEIAVIAAELNKDIQVGDKVFEGKNLQTRVSQDTAGKTTIEIGLNKNIEVEKLDLKDDKGNATSVTPTGVSTTNADGTKTDLTAEGIEVAGKDGKDSTVIGKDGIGIDGEQGSTTLTDGGATFVNKDATNPSVTTIDGGNLTTVGKDGKSGLNGEGLTVSGTGANGDKGESTVGKDGLTVSGKDGQDAVALKADENGSQLTLKGKDGENGITLTATDGADGKSALEFKDGKGVVDGLKGIVGTTPAGATDAITDITKVADAARTAYNNQAVSGKDLFNVIDNGLRVNANQGGLQTHKLGNEIAVIAAELNKDIQVGDKVFEGKNLQTRVSQDTAGKTTIEIGLNKNIEVEKLDLKDDKGNATSVTPTGVSTTNADGTKTDLTAEGIEVAGKDGKDSTVIGKDGIGIDGEQGSTTLTDGGATFVNKDATNPSVTTIDGGNLTTVGKDGKSGLNGEGLTVSGTGANGDKGESTVGKDGLTVIGKDGQDAVALKADENGSQLTLKGKDGENGITLTATDGADGKSALEFKDGKGVVDGLKGIVGTRPAGATDAITDITKVADAARTVYNNQAVSGKDLFNVIDNGLRVNANQGGLQTHKLGNEIAVIAAELNKDIQVGDKVFEGKNLQTRVSQDAAGKTTIEIGLNKNIEVEKLDLKDDKGNATSVTPTGVSTTNADGTKTDLTAEGIEVAGKDGKDSTVIGKDGIGIDGEQGSTTLTDGGATFVNKDATNPSVTTIDGGNLTTVGKDGKSGLNGEGLTVSGTGANGDKGESTVGKDGLTVSGKDGQDAVALKADENGSQLTLKGKDGENGITLTATDGADGKSALEFKDGKGVVDGLKGIVGTTPAGATDAITDITKVADAARTAYNNQAVSGKDLFNVIDNGLRVNANQGGLQTHKLGNEIAVIAAELNKDIQVGDKVFEGKNLQTRVSQDTAGKTTIEIGLNKNIEVEKLDLKDDKGNATSVTPTGVSTTNADGTKTDLTAEGIEVAGKDGKDSTVIGKDGIGIDGEQGSTTLTDGGATFVNKDAAKPGVTTIDGGNLTTVGKDGKSGLNGEGLTVSGTGANGDKGESTVGKDGLTVSGKDGQDAVALKADENGSQLTLKGKDGENGITLTATDGADGKSALEFKDGKGVVDGLKGIVGTRPAGATDAITDITKVADAARTVYNNQAVSGKDLFNVIDNGLRVNANQGGLQTHKLGNEISVVALANASGEYVGDNLKTFISQDTATGKTTIEIGLKKDIQVDKLDLKDDKGNTTTVTPTGVVSKNDDGRETVLNQDGVSVSGENGVSRVDDGKVTVSGDNGASGLNDKGLTVVGNDPADKGSSNVGKDGLTVVGKDGKGAVSVKADADGNGQIVVNGKDGVNGLTISAKDGVGTIAFNDNKGVITGLENRTVASENYGVGTNETRAATEGAVKGVNDRLTDVVANGISVGATLGQANTVAENVVTQKLGGQLNIVETKGFEAEGKTYEGTNLKTKVTLDENGNSTVEIGLNKNIEVEKLDLKDDQGNSTTINAGGISSQGNNGSASLSENGVSVNGKGADGKDGKDGANLSKDGLVLTNSEGNTSASVKTDANGNGQLAINGKDGKDGVNVGVNENGGVITLTGRDGENATPSTSIQAVKGDKGLDGQDATRITYTNGTNVDGTPKIEQVANLNDGLVFSGDVAADKVSRKLNTELTLKGGADTTKLTDNNIAVVKDTTDGANGLNIKLAQDVKDLNSVSVGQAGNQTVITANQFAMTATDAADPAKSNTFRIENTANGAKISGVADGDISPESNDVVTGSQLYQVTKTIAGGAEMQTKQVMDVNGNPVEKVVVTDNTGKEYTLTTYNVHGQSEVITNNVVTAIHNMNEQGIKFFHTNDGEAKPKREQDNTIDSSASGAYATAVGYQASATAAQALAIGHGATATGVQSLAIGTGNQVSGSHAGAIGDPNIVKADNSYVYGNNNTVTETARSSFAVGNDNTIETENTYVLGSGIKNTLANSVFLGNNAGYVAAGATTAGNRAYESAIFNGMTHYYAGGKAEEVAGVVSVGNVSEDGVQQTRRIQNVAPGLISRHSTDAINGSQLYGAVTNLNANINQLGNRLTRVDHDLRSGIAGAVAIGSLVQAYNPSDSILAVGGGTYRGASALAVGYSKVSDNGRIIFKVNGSMNNSGHYMGGASVGFKF